MFWRAAVFSLLEEHIFGAYHSSSVSWCLNFPALDLLESDPFEEMPFVVDDKDLLL